MKKKKGKDTTGRSERKSKSPTTRMGEDAGEENDVANAKRTSMTREESGVKRKRGSNVRETENTKDSRGVKKSKTTETKSRPAKKTKSTAGGKETASSATDKTKEKSMNSKRGKLLYTRDRTTRRLWGRINSKVKIELLY